MNRAIARITVTTLALAGSVGLSACQSDQIAASQPPTTPAVAVTPSSPAPTPAPSSPATSTPAPSSPATSTPALSSPAPSNPATAPAAPPTSPTADSVRSAFAGTPEDWNHGLDHGSHMFTSPDGTFHCGIESADDSRSARAGCQGDTSPLPARPTSCPTSTLWGDGMTVDANGSTHFLCADDVEFPSRTAAPLAYGQMVTALGFTCASRHDGIWCRDDNTGHGFRIASDSNVTF